VANEVKVTIRAEDRSRQATQEAAKNMQGVEKAAERLQSTLKTAFTVGGIIAAGRAIAQVSRELIEAYSRQELAERKLQAAVARNPYMDDKSVRRLKEYANELQALTNVSDDVVLSEAGMLAALGYSEDQITRNISAAADLSAVLGIDLHSAVRMLTQAQEGNTSQLARYIPQIRNLTEEQLAAGGAVDLVATQFKGMAEQMADTTDGSMKRFGNALGDLKEAMGESFAKAARPVLDFFTELIKQTTEAIQKTNDLASAFERIRGGNADVDALLTVYRRNLEVALNARAAGGSRAVGMGATDEYIDDLRRKIAALERSVNPVGPVLTDAWRTAAESRIAADTRAAAAAEAYTVAQKAAADAASEAFEQTKHLLTPSHSAEYDAHRMMDAWDMTVFEMLDSWEENAINPMQIMFRSLFLGTNKLLESMEAHRGEVLQMGAAVREVTEDLGGLSFTDHEGWGVEAAAGAKAPAMMAADPMLILIQAFAELAAQIESITQLMSPLKIIFDGILAVIGPVLNDALAPVIGMFRLLGEAIGHMLVPFIEAAIPIITFLAQAFVWLYNKALVPLVNGVKFLGNAIYNAVASMINWVIGILNRLPGVNLQGVAYRAMDEGFIGEINLGDLSAAGQGQMGTGGSAPAQYTTGRNITINMEVYTDAIVGENGFRQFALMVRDEIYAAEALGA